MANAIVTKEQERKALEKIREIVAGLGEDSYIATAFEGCFEDAEQNIENDFGCSMKQRYESEKETADFFKSAAEHYSAELDKATERIKALEAKLPQDDDLVECIDMARERASDIERAMMEAADKIVELADDPSGSEFLRMVNLHRSRKAALARANALVHRLQILLK